MDPSLARRAQRAEVCFIGHSKMPDPCQAEPAEPYPPPPGGRGQGVGASLSKELTFS